MNVENHAEGRAAEPLQAQLEALRVRVVALLESWAGLNAADPSTGEQTQIIEAQARTLDLAVNQLGESIEGLPPAARDPLLKRWRALARQIQVVVEDLDPIEEPTEAPDAALTAQARALSAQAVSLAQQAARAFTPELKRSADMLLLQLHTLADQIAIEDPNNVEAARLLADTRLDLDFVRRGANGTHSLRVRLG